MTIGSFDDLLAQLQAQTREVIFTTERSWKRRRCANSGQSLWLRKAVHKRVSSPISLHYAGLVAITDSWYTPAEGLLEQIKS